MGEMKNATSLKDIFKFYVSSHPELKKFWKKKSKALAAEFNLEAVNKKNESESESEEEVKPKAKAKAPVKKVESESESEEEVKPKAKAKTPVKKVESESESEEEVKPKAKAPIKKVEEKTTTLLTKKTARKESSDESESEEEVKKPLPKPKADSNGYAKNNATPIAKTPFKRIDDSLKDVLPKSLQDNSYQNLMSTTGENYGEHANEKLKFTKGKDFKKEKTKFKNKTAFGGLNISTQVRSIKLDSDSD